VDSARSRVGSTGVELLAVVKIIVADIEETAFVKKLGEH
jgi:hypothetical protein